jgi:hypothetical protein
LENWIPVDSASLFVYTAVTTLSNHLWHPQKTWPFNFHSLFSSCQIFSTQRLSDANPKNHRWKDGEKQQVFRFLSFSLRAPKVFSALLLFSSLAAQLKHRKAASCVHILHFWNVYLCVMPLKSLRSKSVDVLAWQVEQLNVNDLSDKLRPLAQLWWQIFVSVTSLFFSCC